MIDCSNTSGTCTSGGSRPSEKDGGMGGGGKGCAHRDPQIKQWGGGGGWFEKIFFGLFGPQFGLKRRGEGGPLPRICHCVHCTCIIVMVNLRNKFHLEKYQYAKYGFSQSQ